jgi:hypothetical protein
LDLTPHELQGPQLVLLHLPARGGRQLVDDVDAAWHLEEGEPRGDVRAERVHVDDIGAAVRLHPRVADVAEARVGYAEDRGPDHERVSLQRRLDLHGVDALAADPVVVPLPADEGDVSPLVELGDVAGPEPAVGVEGPGGLSRLIPVLLHDEGSAQVQRTGVADGRRRAADLVHDACL